MYVCPYNAVSDWDGLHGKMEPLKEKSGIIVRVGLTSGLTSG